MMKKTALVAACTITIQLAGCATKHATTSTETPEQERASVKATYSETQIMQGKTIFQHSCNKCHDYKMPEDYSVKEWDKVLPSMLRKSHLNGNDAGMVRAWIITNTKSS